MQLAKAVGKLQNRQIGAYQKGYQYFTLGVNTGEHGLNVSNPCCFALQCFYNDQDETGTPVYVGHTDIAHHAHVRTIATHFADVPVPCSANGLLAQYDYWFNSQDTVSPVRYLPIRSKMTFNVEYPNMASNAVPLWVRVDIVRMKKNLQINPHVFELPQNLPALGHMADDELNTRNRYNRTYFQVYTTKWIRLDNEDAPSNKTIRKQCTIDWKFSPKELTIDKEPGDVGTGNFSQSFISNMPQNKIFWVVMSTNSNLAEASNVKLKCNRFISWRDPHGKAA